jgi:hypothetical protein
MTTQFLHLLLTLQRYLTWPIFFFPLLFILLSLISLTQDAGLISDQPVGEGLASEEKMIDHPDENSIPLNSPAREVNTQNNQSCLLNSNYISTSIPCRRQIMHQLRPILKNP